jgi:hypothetical protein
VVWSAGKAVRSTTSLGELEEAGGGLLEGEGRELVVGVKTGEEGALPVSAGEPVRGGVHSIVIQGGGGEGVLSEGVSDVPGKVLG